MGTWVVGGGFDGILALEIGSGPIEEFFGIGRAQIDTSVAFGSAEVVVPVGTVEAEAAPGGNFGIGEIHSVGDVG